MITQLNITNFNLEIKEMMNEDRKKLGMSQREYIEYLITEEHKRLQDDEYLLEKIKNPPK